MAVVQGARSEGKIKTEIIDEGCHPADILTKPLHEKEFEFKRGRLLGPRATPPTRPSPDAGATANANRTEDGAGCTRGARPDSSPGRLSPAHARTIG